VVSFRPRPLYFRRKRLQYPLDRRLGGPQNRSGRCGEERFTSGTHWIRGWVGPRAGLDTVERRDLPLGPIGPKGEWMGTRTGLDAMEKRDLPQYPLDRRLGGPQSRSGRCGEERFTPGTHWIGGWVGPRAGLDAVGSREILSPCQELNHSSPLPQDIAQ
jgi:hypothetical protein